MNVMNNIGRYKVNMSYADIASKMSSEDGAVGKHFKIDTDQLVFRDYNKEAIFNDDLFSKDQRAAFVRYMQMYGGGEWHDGVHSDVPYYYTYSKVECTRPLGGRWEYIQDMIKNNVRPWLYDKYQQTTGSQIAIQFQSMNAEYVFTDSCMPLCRFINAMQSYYNKLQYHDEIQTTIDGIVKSIQHTISDLFISAMAHYDAHKVTDLYKGVSIDYCAYRINDSIHYIHNSCFVGRLYLADTSNDKIRARSIDGMFTTNNISTLMEASGADSTIGMSDVLAEDSMSCHPMEFALFDNYKDYGYCIRIMSKSKSLLFVILRNLLEVYNCNNVKDLNKL